MSEQQSFVFNYKSVEHTAISIGSNELPALEKIISVHALIFMADSNVVVVDVRSRGVDLPGGHVEEHETSATQTLKRELIEEANVTVKDLELLDVLLVSSDLIGPNDKCYIVIFLANVDTLGEFTPNDEIGNRLILNVDEFSEQYFAHAPEYIRHLFTIATQS